MTEFTKIYSNNFIWRTYTNIFYRFCYLRVSKKSLFNWFRLKKSKFRHLLQSDGHVLKYRKWIYWVFLRSIDTSLFFVLKSNCLFGIQDAHTLFHLQMIKLKSSASWKCSDRVLDSIICSRESKGWFKESIYFSTIMFPWVTAVFYRPSLNSSLNFFFVS